MDRLGTAAEPLPMPPRTWVAVVNYRCAELSIRCLESLAQEMSALPGSRVVVVDNDSRDGSADRLETVIAQRGWSWASVDRSPVNGGFAWGNNRVVRAALTQPQPPDYLWLLNPDTEARPGALRALADYLGANPEAGLVGSRLEFASGEVWPFAFRFPSLLSEVDRGLRWGVISRWLRSHVIVRAVGDRAEQVDWMPGASVMVRREVFEQVGLLDEDFFLYFEETDFFLRARRAGWPAWYVPASTVMHLSGQSTGVTGVDAHRNRVPRYWFDSRRRYFMKNHGWVYTALTDALWMACFALWRLRRRVQGQPDLDPPHLLADFFRSSALWHWTLPVNSVLAGNERAS